MDFLNQRLNALELRTKRDNEHVLTVIAGQRERVDLAFDQVKLAMLQQELALRQYFSLSEGRHTELCETVQELAKTVDELAKSTDERLKKLENPPAA